MRCARMTGPAQPHPQEVSGNAAPAIVFLALISAGCVSSRRPLALRRILHRRQQATMVPWRADAAEVGQAPAAPGAGAVGPAVAAHRGQNLSNPQSVAMDVGGG